MAGVALGDIHLDFTWQAWHNLTSTVVLRGRRGTDGTGWRAWTGFHVAGVAQPHIYRRFAWQAWDRWHWVARLDWFRRRRDARDAAPLLRGRRGTWWHPPWFHVAGVAQPHIYRRFAWQAWDRWHWVARLDWFRRRRDARDAAPLLRGRRGTWWHLPWFHVAGVAQPHLCVAGVAQPHIHLRFAWQAWQNSRPPSFCVAGVAQTHIYRRFAWQAWHLATFTFVLCGRKSHLPSFCVADLTSTVVLSGRRGTDGTGWRAWTGLGAAVTPVTPRHFCVAGVAQPHIYRRFVWQAWDRWHWVARLDWFRRRRDARDAAPLLRGRRGTWWHPPWFHVAGVAQPHIYRRFCVAGVGQMALGGALGLV